MRCCTVVLVQGSCKCCNTIFLFFSFMVLICQHARSSHRLGKLLTEAINMSAMSSLNWGSQCNAYNLIGSAARACSYFNSIKSLLYQHLHAPPMAVPRAQWTSFLGEEGSLSWQPWPKCHSTHEYYADAKACQISAAPGHKERPCTATHDSQVLFIRTC